MGQEMMIEAEYYEIPFIVRLTKGFYNESKHALPFNALVFSSTVARFISDENCCVIVYKTDGKIQGFLMGICSQYPAADLVQANEFLWYCSKSNRGYGALKMFKQYKKWAKSKGAKLIFAGAFEARASKLYERLGFTLIDENWVRAY